MRSKGDGLGSTMVWLIGGLVLSVAALFAMFGGFILGLLMLAATPFVVAFLALDAIFGKRPVYVESAAAEQAGARVLELARVVTARVVAAEGTCPLEHRFQIGDAWTINGRVEGREELCPTAALVLRNAAARLKEGVPGSEEVRCVGAGHRVIFALDGRRARAAPSTQRERAPEATAGRYGNAA